MKKVALSLAVLFAVALVSCNNKENKEEAVVDSAAIEAPVDTVATDTAATVDTAAVEAPADSAPAQK